MHVGLIPDGNRRFMSKRHIGSLLTSYDMGINRFYDFLSWCYDLGVDEVTIYALSLENLEARSVGEIETLFKVFNKHAKKGLKDKNIHGRGIRVCFCGDRQYLLDRAPKRKLAEEMLENIVRLEEATSKYSKFRLNLAIAYGSRQEIVHAARQAVANGGSISEETIKANLWVKGEPDLLIRTSESRLSNFMLWQSAYSEIYFVPKLWQEFEKKDLEEVLGDFRSRQRRYGR